VAFPPNDHRPRGVTGMLAHPRPCCRPVSHDRLPTKQAPGQGAPTGPIYLSRNTASLTCRIAGAAYVHTHAVVRMFTLHQDRTAAERVTTPPAAWEFLASRPLRCVWAVRAPGAGSRSRFWPPPRLAVHWLQWVGRVADCAAGVPALPHAGSGCDVPAVAQRFAGPAPASARAVTAYGSGTDLVDG
jgi:hypothetical protein